VRIARELQQKGISKTLIAQVMDEAFDRGGTRVAARARDLLQRRFHGKDLHEPRNLRRAAALLHRQGYPAAVIEELLGQPE
jgi:SOS response regulatory protein OraA/RecX